MVAEIGGGKCGRSENWKRGRMEDQGSAAAVSARSEASKWPGLF